MIKGGTGLERDRAQQKSGIRMYTYAHIADPQLGSVEEMELLGLVWGGESITIIFGLVEKNIDRNGIAVSTFAFARLFFLSGVRL